MNCHGRWSECDTLRSGNDQKERFRTITEKRFAIGRSNAKDRGHEYVLEGRDEEKGSVLEADNVEGIRINDWCDVPFAKVIHCGQSLPSIAVESR